MQHYCITVGFEGGDRVRLMYVFPYFVEISAFISYILIDKVLLLFFNQDRQLQARVFCFLEFPTVLWKNIYRRGEFYAISTVCDSMKMKLIPTSPNLVYLFYPFNRLI